MLSQLAGPVFRRGAGSVMLARPSINRYVIVDAFFDPYGATVSQFNTDFRLQRSNEWYVEVGQRASRDGNRVRRGDIWNPVSFNEVYAPTEKSSLSRPAARLDAFWMDGQCQGILTLKTAGVRNMMWSPCIRIRANAGHLDCSISISRPGAVQFHAKSDRHRLDRELRDERCENDLQSYHVGRERLAMGFAGWTLWPPRRPSTAATDRRSTAMSVKLGLKTSWEAAADSRWSFG